MRMHVSLRVARIFIGPMKVSERRVMSSECDKMHKGKQILESH